MKKFFSIFLALIMLLTLGLSMGASAEGSDLTGTLSILSWYNETTSAPVIEGFKAKYPNVTVDYTYAPPVADYIEKLNTLLYTDTAPDVFYMALENRESLTKGGYCMDLSGEPYMQDGTIPDAVKEMYSNCAAVDCWVGGLFYNKDIFAACGITEEPKTWDEFLNDCQILQDNGYVPLMDNCQDAAVNFVTALFGSETKAKDPDFTAKVFAGEAKFVDGWTKPYAMLKELVDKGYLTADMVGIAGEDMVTQFATGQVAMIMTGSWYCSVIDELNPDLNYEIMGIPGTEKVYYCGCINVGPCINAKAKYPEVAKAFIEYCVSPEGLEAQYSTYGGFTVAKGFTPELRDEVKDAVAAVQAGEFHIPMSEWISYTESLRLTFLAGVQDVLVGACTPEEAAGRLDAKLAEVSAQ